MTKREARRIALLVIADEVGGSLEVSDEWARHPETDRLLEPDERTKVVTEARQFLAALETRIAALGSD